MRQGDRDRILYRIEQGRIRPSKNLADHLVALLSGKREFLMIDDQKIVYERALALAKRAAPGNKKVLIVQGGPGTGKSVVAINLLVELTRLRKVAQYVTRNRAPREVFQAKLAGTFKKGRITNLFKNSGSFIEAEPDSIDALVVDEAHRLNEKSGLYRNLGDNQIAEIVRAAQLSVFFVDEDQRVTWNDIGEPAEIRRHAEAAGAEIHELELASQFRCNGSDGYLAWIDDVLQIRQTANPTLDGVDYEFRVFDDPNALRQAIVEKNRASNKARMVAGYCWDWKGKKDPTVKDVRIDEHDFAMRWNLDKDGGLWILQPESINEIGCIHTCQGLELEYVGVIVGPDLVVRDGEVVVDAGKRSGQDSSIKGYKKMLKEDPDRARARADRIVKNTYRTLMTRGQKGCFLYCTDPETAEYFRSRMGEAAARGVAAAATALTTAAAAVDRPRYPGLPLRLVPPEEARPFENCVPIFDLAMAAAHDFGAEQTVEACDWVELPDDFRPVPAGS